MLNKIFLQGRIVNDIDVKTTPSGASVCTFRIAVDRDFKNQNGEKETDFVTIVAWKKTAEFLYKFFGKGRMIVVDGRLQMRNYTDRDGNKRTAAEVVAENVYFGDSKKEEEGSIPHGGYPAPAYEQGNFAELKDGDDGELPF